MEMKLSLERKLEFEIQLWQENWIRIKIEIISWTEITLGSTTDTKAKTSKTAEIKQPR